MVRAEGYSSRYLLEHSISTGETTAAVSQHNLHLWLCCFIVVIVRLLSRSLHKPSWKLPSAPSSPSSNSTLGKMDPPAPWVKMSSTAWWPLSCPTMCRYIRSTRREPVVCYYWYSRVLLMCVHCLTCPPYCYWYFWFLWVELDATHILIVSLAPHCKYSVIHSFSYKSRTWTCQEAY